MGGFQTQKKTLKAAAEIDLFRLKTDHEGLYFT